MGRRETDPTDAKEMSIVFYSPFHLFPIGPLLEFVAPNIFSDGRGGRGGLVKSRPIQNLEIYSPSSVWESGRNKMISIFRSITTAPSFLS